MFQFHTVEEALADLKNGKIILVTDDPDRENEGDFICAAEFATTENVNFMATHGYFRRRAVGYGDELCGRRCKAGGFSKAGAYVSAFGKRKRRFGAAGPYGSDGRPVPSCRVKGMRAVLRDYAGRRHDDAQAGADCVSRKMESDVYYDQRPAKLP